MNQIQALGLTLACELPVMVTVARSQFGLRLMLVATTASCLTHPFVWKIASVLSDAEYVTGIWLIETGVVLIEALWYRLWLPVSWRLAFLWSLIANLVSFFIGWLWQSA